MNKETVSARLAALKDVLDQQMQQKAQLEGAMQQLAGNINAQRGAISDCEHWLAVLTKEEETKAAAPPAEPKAEAPAEPKPE